MLPLVLLAAVGQWATPALGWAYDIQTFPTQCGSLNINITEQGTAPYEFTFYKLAGVDLPFSSWGNGSLWNVTIPFGDPKGEEADFILPWPAGDQVVVVGSDATGFASGGTSQLYTIAESTSNDTACLISKASNTTYLNLVPVWTEPVQQCGTMTAVFYGVVLPVKIDVVVPGGNSFVTTTGATQYPTTPDSNNRYGVLHAWPMNLTQGTNVAFQVSDATGPLFTSSLLSVQAGNDTCLSGGSTPSSGSGSNSDTTGGSSGKSKSGAIAGGVVGGLAAALIAAAAIMFAIRQYNRRKLLQRRQTIGLTAYAATKPERLARETWPEGERYRDDPEEAAAEAAAARDASSSGAEDKIWERMDRRMTTIEPRD